MQATQPRHISFTRLSHSLAKILALFCLLITVGIGNAWAGAGLYEVYFGYSYNGTTGSKTCTSYGTETTDLGTLTADFEITSLYLKFWKDGSGNMCGGLVEYYITSDQEYQPSWTWYHSGGNNHELQSTDSWTVAQYNTGPSGAYTFWYRFKTWGSSDNSSGCGTNYYIPTDGSSKNKFTYKIAPPAVSSFTVTPKGAISGSGTSVDPYIIPYGGDLTLTMSGSQERSDVNSTAKYYNTSSGSSWTTQNYKTISNITSSDAASVTIKMCYENNSTSSLKGAESSSTIYYKAAKGVPVYKFVTKSSDLGTGEVCAELNTEYEMTTSNSLSTLTGGTLKAYATKASNLTYNNNSFKFAGASGWLILGLENKIKAGDVIRYINSGGTNASVAIRTAKSTTTNQILLTGNGSSTVQTAVITDAQATAFASLNTVYMVRSANNCYISYFEILRPYAVILDANTNGGKVNGNNKDTIYYAQSESQALPHAFKDDNHFNGWFAASSGGLAVSNPYTATTNTTLYAQWEDCQSSGTVYKFQVGTSLTDGSVTANNVAFDFNVGNYLSNLTGGTLSTAGSNASNVTIVDNNSISIGNTNSYLQIDLDCATEVGDTIKTIVTSKTAWLHDGTTRTQTMTIATSANTSTYQKQVIPADLEDKSTLYLFRGSGTCKVLYFEIIRPVKYTITYDAGTYGTGSIDAGTKIYNGDFTLSSSTFSRDGATQDGWATSDGGDKVYELGATYTTNADLTLYPHWIHTITYYDNGSISGSAPSAGIHNDGSDAIIKDNVGLMQHTGDSVFAGWATTANATTATYQPGDIIEDISADVDLYPVWKDGCYLISLTGSGTAGTKNTTDFYAPQTLLSSAKTVKGICFSKSYYKLSGLANGTAPNYLAMTGCGRFVYYDTKTDNTSLTVYISSASSSAQSFYYQVLKEGDMQALQTVALPANGDTVVTIDVAHAKGTRVVFGASNEYVYITQIKAVEDGDPIVAVGEDGFEIAIPGRPVANLVAASRDYKGSVDGVVFHSTRTNPPLYTGTNPLILIGTSEETCADYIEFTTIAPTQLLVTCRNANAYQYYVKTGKTFDSSSDTKYGVKGGVSKVNLTSAATWYILSDTVQITKIAFAAAPEITYHANGGTGTMDNTIATIATNTFTRDGYTFSGWNTEDDGSGDTYTAGTEVFESLDLYAQWAHTITYHSATDDDYLVENIAHGADLDDEHAPTNCATDRVFIGWATSEVSTQQSEPTIVSTDGTLEDITTNMDLYAVFASRNGSDGHDYVDNFNGYTTTTTYNSATPKIYGIWSVTYGTASNLTDVTGKMGSNAILLQKGSGTAAMVTSKKIHNFTGLTCKIATTHSSVYFVIEYSTNGSSWTILEGPTTHGAVRTAASYTRSVAGDPVDAYVRFRITAADGTTADYRMYIDDVTLYSKPHDWIITDYSTACTKPATVTVTFDKNGGTGDVPASPATGGSITLPTLTKAGYMFDGFTAQADGQDVAEGIYYAGESFLVNHDVSMNAQWTKYFEDIDGVSPITTGKDIAIRSIEVDSIVVNSDDCGTPTADITGDDKALFEVTIDAAHKRVAGGKTRFPYYVTYTPTSHNVINDAEITFTCDGVESSAVTVRGRSLPEEFVIVGKYADDGKWYALPNTLASSSGTNPVPTAIYVDNNTTPTKALLAPSTTAYKAADRFKPTPNTQFASIRLTPDGTNYIRGGTGDNSLWLTTSSSVNTNWSLASSDLTSYLVKQDPANAIDKRIGFWAYSGVKMGFHATAPKGSDIYFLPIENKASEYAAIITTWSQHHIEIELSEALTSDADGLVTWLNGADEEASAVSGSGTTYSATFDELDLAGQTGKELILIWKDGSTVLGGSRVIIPSIVAPSAEQDSWSDITATASDIVVLNQTTTVDVTDAVAKAVVLTNESQLIINANKALVVTGKITREDGTPTHPEDLIIQSSAAGNGTLIFENDGDSATVQMYSKATQENQVHWQWQWIATPVDSIPSLSFYGSYLYEWPSDATGWNMVTRGDTLTIFTGYTLSNKKAGSHEIKGMLAPTTSKNITVPAGKDMVIGNSWTAPIQITQMDEDDFVNVEQTIYLFNTGMDSEEQGAGAADAGDRYKAGTYVTIPINETEDVGVSKISSLQGFYVTNSTGSAGSLTLSYSKHIRPTGTNTVDNGAMHAPKRTEEKPIVLKMWASGSRYDDRLILVEREDFSIGFDNGWDGKKLDEPGDQPMLYTIREDGTKDAVSALPELDGTVIAFRAGEDESYTLRFEYNGENGDASLNGENGENDELYLYDIVANKYAEVVSGNTYTFTTTDKEEHGRFILTHSNAPQITTDVEEPTSDSSLKGRAKKMILEQKFFIYRNGVLYDGMGKRVESGETRVEREE